MAAGDFKQSTNLVGKILASSQVAGSAANTTIYTVPAASAVKVATFSITNVSNAAVTVSVSVVPSGGTVDSTHQVVANYSLSAFDSTKITEVEGSLLDANAFISIIASSGGAINYLLTGAISS